MTSVCQSLHPAFEGILISSIPIHQEVICTQRIQQQLELVNFWHFLGFFTSAVFLASCSAKYFQWYGERLNSFQLKYQIEVHNCISTGLVILYKPFLFVHHARVGSPGQLSLYFTFYFRSVLFVSCMCHFVSNIYLIISAYKQHIIGF